MITLLLFLFVAGGQKKPAKPEPRQTVTVTDGYGNLLSQPFQENPKDDRALVTVKAGDGSQVILLGYSEYAHLQELRKAVVDEEKRLAVKYGANPWSAMDCLNMQRGATKEDMKELGIYPGLTNKCDPESYPDRKDHYEYHGQFLLIEKGGK